MLMRKSELQPVLKKTERGGYISSQYRVFEVLRRGRLTRKSARKYRQMSEVEEGMVMMYVAVWSWRKAEKRARNVWVVGFGE